MNSAVDKKRHWQDFKFWKMRFGSLKIARSLTGKIILIVCFQGPNKSYKYVLQGSGKKCRKKFLQLNWSWNFYFVTERKMFKLFQFFPKFPFGGFDHFWCFESFFVFFTSIFLQNVAIHYQISGSKCCFSYKLLNFSTCQTLSWKMVIFDLR